MEEEPTPVMRYHFRQLLDQLPSLHTTLLPQLPSAPRQCSFRQQSIASTDQKDIQALSEVGITAPNSSTYGCVTQIRCSNDTTKYSINVHSLFLFNATNHIANRARLIGSICWQMAEARFFLFNEYLLSLLSLQSWYSVSDGG